MSQPFWVYMLRCSDGSFYVGHTDELERRLRQHEDGGYCRWTRSRRPLRLVFSADIGGSISTPIIVGDSIVAAGYDETVHLYRIRYRRAETGDEGALPSRGGDWWTVSVRETARHEIGASIESTP
ncbi:MAG: GIY-YIG nuclease family protein, partial [Anaerolineae bacterium]